MMMTTEQRDKMRARIASNSKWSIVSMLIIVACLTRQYFLQGSEGITAVGFIMCWAFAILLIVNQFRMVWESYRLSKRLDADTKEYIQSTRGAR